ncbi:MAG: HD domain-containing protein [Eubacterium sp.]|nr:HD domain-containing protein [Eubacterium sp.]
MSIDRNHVTEVFKNYTAAYDLSDPKVLLKVEHTYRVAEFCDRIAGSLSLSEEDTDFAWLSGILHDIGRFEQLRRYHTFMDKHSVNHAELSADLLFRDLLIRRFAEAGGIDEGMMEKVIRYHNVYALPENLSDRERMFCDILRDADKVDILRVNCETPRTEIYDLPEDAFTNSKITEAVYSDIMNERNVDRRNSSTGIDYILGHIGFVYGLVFPESFRMVEEQGYLEELLSFRSRQPETARKMGLIRRKVEGYVQGNL